MSYVSIRPDYEPPYQQVPITPMALEFLPSNLMTSPQLFSRGPQLYPATVNPTDNPTLDQMNISRTVILKNLNNTLGIERLLDHIDFGPIEYCKIISKQQNKIGTNQEGEIYKICFISFINSQLSINFYLKYSKPNHMNKLKLDLDSPFLKIQLNDNKIYHNKDLIKLKTLNYINEFNASRSLQFTFKSLDPTLSNTDDEKKYLLDQFFKLAVDYEHFHNNQVHFLTIDTAIKVYEFFSKLIHANNEKLINHEPTDDIPLVTSCTFIKDRCDRTAVGSANFANSAPSSPLPETDLNEDSSNVLLDYNSTNELSSVDEESNDEYFASPHIPHRVLPSPNIPGMETPYYSMNYNLDPCYMGNRTIYLGNLHPQSTVEEIANNVRAGGLVESIKYYPEKRNCFITFIDANVALKFFLNHQVSHQLIIHGYDINVGWAKTHSGPLNREISLSVTAGASRNVYIGIKMLKVGVPMTPKVDIPSAEDLRQDFQPFGELEQVNFYHNNDCAFLNFCHIIDAIRLVELFDSKSSEKLNYIANNPQFYKKYQFFKVSFGKDRCGNPPKYSFKKKSGKQRQKIYFDKNLEEKETQLDNSKEITDEAALVFGIIKDDVKTDKLEPQPHSESPKKDDDNHNNSKKNRNEDNNHSEENCNDDEEDNEDEISIIIGSDDTSSIVNNTNGSLKKKLYNTLVNSSDPFIPLRNKKNNSNLSLNKNHHQPHRQHSQTIPQYAYQPVFMTNSVPSPYVASPMVVSPQVNQFGYTSFYPPTPIGPQFVAPGGYGPPYYYDNSLGANRNSISGSQVMAQYLAKSQMNSYGYPNLIERKRK